MAGVRRLQGRGPVRRENKLALIVGFSVLLVVAVLVSDHLSQARRDEVGDGLAYLPELPDERLLLDTPLTAESRVVPGRPTRTAANGPERSSAGAPVANGGETPVDRSTRLTRATPPVTTPIPETERVGSPMILSNGPAAAERLADNSVLKPVESRSDLLGLDTSKIRALLETVRSGSARATGETPKRINGHIASAGKYVVQPGDTLYEICERLYGEGDRWHELVANNKGKVRSDGTVYVGVTLDLLPGVKTTRATRNAESRAGSPKSRQNAKTRRYTVKKGDTLGEIAQREVGSVRYLSEIRRLNPSLTRNKDRIMVGQTLVLPARRAG